jgi:hypothetical protein
MIAGHIEDLITAAKDLPNSLHKNKMVSHLQDALAHGTLLELEAGHSSVGVPAQKPPQCTCVPGAISADCPIHTLH